MKIWKSIKTNYSNFKDYVEIIGEPILDWINEATRPICPICNSKKYWYTGSDKSMVWECAKDGLTCVMPGWFRVYYKFLDKTYSEKQFDKVLKMKAFW